MEFTKISHLFVNLSVCMQYIEAYIVIPALFWLVLIVLY